VIFLEQYAKATVCIYIYYIDIYVSISTPTYIYIYINIYTAYLQQMPKRRNEIFGHWLVYCRPVLDSFRVVAEHLESLDESLLDLCSV
jgi:hypothetical protein